MTAGDGMSFAEFTYPLLQAWDWWHMYSRHGVQVQIGGSDQYGNIVAGMDAIKYIQSGQQDGKDVDAMSAPYGITVPLLTTSSGTKFGKSAGNAVWLDADMTSPIDLYGVRSRLPLYRVRSITLMPILYSFSSAPPTRMSTATSTSSPSFPSTPFPKQWQPICRTPQSESPNTSWPAKSSSWCTALK